MKKVVWMAILIVIFGMLPACGVGEKRENAAEIKNVEQETTKESEMGENIVDDTDDVEEPFDWSTVPVAGENDFEWEEARHGETIVGVEITGYLGSEKAIKVPGILDGKPVVGIGDLAFYKQEQLTSIDLADVSLVWIGYYSFGDCSNLKRVALPDMAIGSMELENPFLGCVSLSEITIGEGSELEMEDGMIYSDTKIILRIPAFADTDAVIREGTTEIADKAFSGCTKLKTIIVPGSVEKIWLNPFEDCSSLTDVYYGGSEQDWQEAIGTLDPFEDAKNVTVHYSTSPSE